TTDAPTPLSLHDALPISPIAAPSFWPPRSHRDDLQPAAGTDWLGQTPARNKPHVRNRAARFARRIAGEDRERQRRQRKLLDRPRSEEHTSELQSPDHLVC